MLFLFAFILLPMVDGGPGRVDIPLARPIGVAVMAIGAVALLVSFFNLGGQLVAQPTPIPDGRLIQFGLYRFVRHPIYLAVLLLIIGGLFRTPSVSGLLVIIASVAFFDAKSTHEERLLTARYPGYEAYREQTRWKMLPGVR